MKPDYVILAGGKGTRLWPSTQDEQKCMLRIMGKPVLEWIVKGVYSNAEKIIIVVGVGKEKIIDFFSSSPYSDKIVYAEQKEPLGTADAVLKAEPFVSDSFITLMGDDFYSLDFYGFIAKNASQKYFIVSKWVEDQSRVAALFEENGKLVKLVEKPPEKKPGPANINVVHVPKNFFNFLKGLKKSVRGEYELTDGINLFAEKEGLEVISFNGYWNGLGYFWHYLELNEYCAKNLLEAHNYGVIDESVSVNGRLYVGKGSEIGAGCKVEGSVWIGENCFIGKEVIFRDWAVIEDGSRISSFAEVSASTIMRNSFIDSFSCVRDSIVCENAFLGERTRVINESREGGTIAVDINGKKIDSEKKRLGCVVGANSRIEGNCRIECGVLIGKNCVVKKNSFVKSNLQNQEVFGGD